MSSESVLLVRLFITSYAPLAVMLALRNSDTLWPIRQAFEFWVFATLAVVGLIDAFRLPRGARRRSHRRVHLSDVKDEGGQVAAYLASYLLPFLNIDVNGWRAAAALTVYFAVLLVVFLRSDLALVNPALYLAGWRVVSATGDTGRVLLLAKRHAAVREGSNHVVSFGRFLVQSSRREKS